MPTCIQVSRPEHAATAGSSLYGILSYHLKILELGCLYILSWSKYSFLHAILPLYVPYFDRTVPSLRVLDLLMKYIIDA